jgi:hypothetical protein
VLLRSDLCGEKKNARSLPIRNWLISIFKRVLTQIKMGKVSEIDGASTAAVAMGCRRNRGCLIPVLLVVAGSQVRRRQQSIHL